MHHPHELVVGPKVGEKADRKAHGVVLFDNLGAGGPKARSIAECRFLLPVSGEPGKLPRLNLVPS